MSRDDLALLVVRVLALLLGVYGLLLVVGMLLAPKIPEADLQSWSVALGAVPIVAGVVLWWLAPPVARAIFARQGPQISLDLTPHAIPPLACFVVGLIQLAFVVPDGASWLAVRAIRGRESSSLINPNVDWGQVLDEQGVSLGAHALARLIVGVVLIALSRRATLWAPDASDPVEEIFSDETPSEP